MDSHTDRVFSLYFHPTKYNELLSGGWDDTVQENPRTSYLRPEWHRILGRGKIHNSLVEEKKTASVCCKQFLPTESEPSHIAAEDHYVTGNKLVTKCYVTTYYYKHYVIATIFAVPVSSFVLYGNTILQSYSTPLHQMMKKCFLYCCRYSKDEETLLLGGSHKNMVRIIDINAKMTIASIKGLNGAVYFAKELPKTDHTTFTQNLCFCSRTAFSSLRRKKLRKSFSKESGWMDAVHRCIEIQKLVQ
ncbi:WD_REPEATS_REGION domain-containing protein [Caerostris extrusa]|uniref:WD_REPEATS_REGION domain-containing protein n=1 Tax=Caerostris extrusa TaxID=172846 RepID=A0AAV4QRJ5_CAEEX|nr:WD_REPEATS_REGION domain-containing protein [Caerostris extrusa]